MAASDEKLLTQLKLLNVAELKSILRSCGVPVSKTSQKEQLVHLCFYASSLGLQILPDAEQHDQARVQARLAKLKLGPFVNLPHPSTLEGWKLDSVNLPPITEEDINSYFSKCKKFFNF